MTIVPLDILSRSGKEYMDEKNTNGDSLNMEVTVRPIEPKGNLFGFASVKFNDCFVVEDFRILQSEKGLFVGMPSKADKSSKSGYRDTAKPITADFRTELTGAIMTQYHAEVEKLQTRADAVRSVSDKQPPIKTQLDQATKAAARDNADKAVPKKVKVAER